MALGALLRSWLRSMGNAGRMVRRQSRLKLAVIVFSSAVLLLGLGAIFYRGFYFLDSLGGAGVLVIYRLFALFFFGLAIMLVFSSTAAAFSTMYRSDEVPSLLTRPVPMGELALYKFLETAVFSSWAFFFMILPFVGAYAIHERLSPLFALWTLLFAVPFVLLCSAVGAALCMVLVRVLPAGRGLYAVLAVAAVGLLAWVWRFSSAAPAAGDESALVLARLIPGIRVSSHPLWPSLWMSEGIMSLAREQWSRGLNLLGLLWSSALAACVGIEALGRWIFYDGWLKASRSARRTGRDRIGRSRFERLFVSGRRRPLRALLLKDMRAFRRDPAQWIQALVFFGLLALYFLNLRQLRYHLLAAEWRNLIVFLNLFSVSAVICSLSSRFVYPQMSLEGHSFWIVGLSPISIRAVLLAKFQLACIVMLAMSLVLAAVSAHMLDVSPLLMAVALGASACIAVAVTAASVGLGSVFLDLQQRNPAAIVSSFGGTLNLIICMAFTFLVMIPLAALFHAFTLGHLSEAAFRAALKVNAAALVIGTTAWVLIALQWGMRSLERREY